MKSTVKLALGELVTNSTRSNEQYVGKIIATVERPTDILYLVELNNFKSGHDGRDIGTVGGEGATVHLLPNVSFERSNRKDRGFFNDWDVRQGILKPYKIGILDGGLL